MGSDGSVPRPRRRTRPVRLVRRAMLTYLVVGAAALVVTGVGTYLTNRAVARSDAVREAEQSATAVTDLVVRPLLVGALNGDVAQVDALNHAVSTEIRTGRLLRLWVWDSSGRIRYADQTNLIGRSFPLSDEAARAITEDSPTVDVCASDLSPSGEDRHTTQVVEVTQPLQVDTTTRLAVVAFFDFAPAQRRAASLTRQMLPLMLAVFVGLQLVQVPIAYALAVRVRRQADERGRLLRRALGSSERERRRIAHDLHDGVVADLAGVGYVLSAVEKTLSGSGRQMVGRAGDTVRGAVSALRTVMVDIYPPDLTGGGLARAVRELIGPLRAAGLTVSTALDVPADLPAPVAAALYRFAREALRNVADHAAATAVRVELRQHDDQVLLRVDDDGVGLPASGIDRRGEGHLGLRLLADSVGDLGGRFEATSSDLGGASIQVSIPSGSHPRRPDLPSGDPTG